MHFILELECGLMQLNYSLALSTNEPIGTNKDNGNVISKKCDSIKSDNMALNKV